MNNELKSRQLKKEIKALKKKISEFSYLTPLEIFCFTILILAIISLELFPVIETKFLVGTGSVFSFVGLFILFKRSTESKNDRSQLKDLLEELELLNSKDEEFHNDFSKVPSGDSNFEVRPMEVLEGHTENTWRSDIEMIVGQAQQS